jgi:lipopolysaccharide export system permease protein
LSLLFRRKLDGYLFQQLAVTILFTLLLLTVIWLAPETLFKLIQGLTGHKLTVNQFWLMVGYHIPPIIQQCLPMSLLFGSLFAIRRLSLNLEWTACLSAGIAPWRMALSVLGLGLIAAVGQWTLQEIAIPYTSPRLENLYWQTQLKADKDTPFLFVEKDPAGNPLRFFFIGQVRRDGLGQFILLDYQRGLNNSLHIGQIVKAPTGEWQQAAHRWVLHDGLRYVLDADGVYQSAQSETNWVIKTPDTVHKLLKYQFYRPLDMSRIQLNELLRLLEAAGQQENLNFYRVRLFQKWTPLLACLLFGLFGVALGLEPVRSRRQDSLLYGVLVLFVYGVSQPLFTNLGSLGVVLPWMAALGPLVLCTSMTALCLLLKAKLRA